MFNWVDIGRIGAYYFGLTMDLSMYVQSRWMLVAKYGQISERAENAIEALQVDAVFSRLESGKVK